MVSPNPLLARFAAYPQRFLPEAICCRRVPGQNWDLHHGLHPGNNVFFGNPQAILPFCTGWHQLALLRSTQVALAATSRALVWGCICMAQRPDPKGLFWSAHTRQNCSSMSCQMHGRHCEDLGGGPSARPAPTLHSLLFRLLMLRL